MPRWIVKLAEDEYACGHYAKCQEANGQIVHTGAHTCVECETQNIVGEFPERRCADCGRYVIDSAEIADQPFMRVYWAHSLEPCNPGVDGQGIGFNALNDEHATQQLEMIATLLGVPPGALTFKPPEGWQGYGCPEKADT